MGLMFSESSESFRVSAENLPSQRLKLISRISWNTCCAVIRSPVSTISMASDFPTARGSLWVPPRRTRREWMSILAFTVVTTQHLPHKSIIDIIRAWSEAMPQIWKMNYMYGNNHGFKISQFKFLRSHVCIVQIWSSLTRTGTTCEGENAKNFLHNDSTSIREKTDRGCSIFSLREIKWISGENCNI